MTHKSLKRRKAIKTAAFTLGAVVLFSAGGLTAWAAAGAIFPQFADVSGKLDDISKKASALANQEAADRTTIAAKETQIQTLQSQITTLQGNQRQAGDPTAQDLSNANTARDAATQKASDWRTVATAAQRMNADDAYHADEVSAQLTAALTAANHTMDTNSDTSKLTENNPNSAKKSAYDKHHGEQAVQDINTKAAAAAGN